VPACLRGARAARIMVGRGQLPHQARLISASRGVRAVRSSLRSRAVESSRRAARPEPQHGLDDYAKPAAADIPAIGVDVDSGELSVAQLSQVLAMHDASDGGQVGSCSRKPPRPSASRRGQDTHHDSVGTCGA
jgi:hypothetical protein